MDAHTTTKHHHTVPVLTTERLVIRPHGEADFDDSFALWADTDVVRFIGGQPSVRSDAWGRVLKYAGLWQLLGYGYWALTDRQTGRFLGEAGLADFKRDMEPPLPACPEAGWALCPHAQGRGLATEAMQAVLRWADETLDFDRSCCLIDADNAPSIRVAEKLGYSRSHQARMTSGAAPIVFERPRQLA